APKSNQEEDDWRRAMIIMQSCTDDEMLDDKLSSYDILFRLFHEEGIRVFDPLEISPQCRCSVERIETVLAMMSKEERDDIVVDDRIAMKCEFCSHEYLFTPKEVESRIREIQSSS
ncbi:MAG: Hsp33 family molecular chaperone HslO, partial [Pseudomonadota bacterium]